MKYSNMEDDREVDGFLIVSCVSNVPTTSILSSCPEPSEDGASPCDPNIEEVKHESLPDRSEVEEDSKGNLLGRLRRHLDDAMGSVFVLLPFAFCWLLSQVGARRS
jgi:hypothetical protein